MPIQRQVIILIIFIVLLSAGCACPYPIGKSVSLLNAKAQDHRSSKSIPITNIDLAHDLSYSGAICNIPQGRWVVTLTITDEKAHLEKELNEIVVSIKVRKCRGGKVVETSFPLLLWSGLNDHQEPPHFKQAICQGGPYHGFLGGPARWYYIDIQVGPIPSKITSLKGQLSIEQYEEPNRYILN